MGSPAKAGRNDACPCGSGKKFKKCCGAKPAAGSGAWLAILVVGALLAAAVFSVSWYTRGPADSPAPGQVWSEEHGHYH